MPAAPTEQSVCLQKSHPGYLSGYDAYARQMSHASVAPSQEDAKIQLWLRGSNSSRPRLQVEQDEPASDAEEEGIYSQGRLCWLASLLTHKLFVNLLLLPHIRAGAPASDSHDGFLCPFGRPAAAWLHATLLSAQKITLTEQVLSSECILPCL